MKLGYTVGMVLVLVALGTYVAIYEREPVAETPGENTAKTAPLLTFDESKLEKVVFSTASQSLTITPTGPKKWRTQPPLKPLDTDKMTKQIDGLKNWQAVDTVMEDLKAADLKTFGLDVPYLTVKATLKGEKAPKEIIVGNKTPTSSGYYTVIKGSPKLYLSNQTAPDEWVGLVRNPTQLQATPKPKAAATPLSAASVPPLIAPPSPADDHSH